MHVNLDKVLLGSTVVIFGLFGLLVTGAEANANTDLKERFVKLGITNITPNRKARCIPKYKRDIVAAESNYNLVDVFKGGDKGNLFVWVRDAYTKDGKKYEGQVILTIEGHDTNQSCAVAHGTPPRKLKI